MSTPMHSIRIHRLRIAMLPGLALCAVLALAPVAWGQAISPEQVTRLNDASFDVREAATRELLRDKALKLDAVLEAYKQVQSAEARHRLLNVAQHCLVREHMAQGQQPGEKGAIGIGLAGVLPRQLSHCKDPAVVVVSTSVGFPGAAHLQANDLITHVNGRALRPSDSVDAIRDEFISMIETLRPNELIDLTVNREGQVQQVRFTLANKTDLQTLYTNRAVGDVPVRLMQPWMEIRRHIEDAGQDIPTLNFQLPDAGQTPRVNEADSADLLSRTNPQQSRRQTTIHRNADGTMTIRIEQGSINNTFKLGDNEEVMRNANLPDTPANRRLLEIMRAMQLRLEGQIDKEQRVEPAEVE